MQCIKCGFENTVGASFCANCGNIMNSTQVQLQQSVYNSSLNVNNSIATATTSPVADSTIVSTKSHVGIAKIIAVIVVVLIVIVVVVVGVSYLFGNKDNDSNTNLNGSSNLNVNYSTYTADVPKDQRTIDYYWNINTATFDKNKFDGRISVFGTIMNTKLTGKTLKDAGFIVVSLSSKDDRPNEKIELNYNSEDDYYSNYGLLYINNKVYPTYNLNVAVDFVNYQGIKSVYDDSTELYFNQNTTYQDVDNIIIPYMENIDYSELTIDDIIDNLGVPTYVEGRTTKLEDTGTSLGAVMFGYVYVYDDYTFMFNFMYYDNTGLSIIGFTYMGSEKFSRPVEVFNRETYKNDIYETYSKLLDEQQDKYLKAIGKNDLY